MPLIGLGLATTALLEHDAFRLNRASCSRFFKTHRLTRKSAAHFFARYSRAAPTSERLE
jgi:hypothetical protein